MPAQSKAELLASCEKEFAKLQRQIADIDADTGLTKDDEDTSIKDVIAHRAHWIDLFLGWYADGQAGRQVSFPADGYKWNELKRYNSDLRARQSHIGWEEAVRTLGEAHRKLVRFVESKSEDDLYGGPMKGAKNDWTPGRWAEAAGPSHYRSAVRYLRARLKVLASGRAAAS